MKQKKYFKKMIASILVVFLLINIVSSNFMNVFASSYHFSTVFYPCDPSKTERQLIGRTAEYHDVMYGCGYSCDICRTQTLTTDSPIFLYSGGSYNFKYFVNACNQIATRGSVKLLDTQGNVISYWDTQKYGGDRPIGKFTNIDGEPAWLSASIPVNVTGNFIIQISTEYQNGPHDMGEYVGFWIKDDYLVQPQYTVNCYDIDETTGATLGSSSWKADYNSTASGAYKGSSTQIGAYYTDYQFVRATTATVTDSNNTVVYRYFKKPIYTLTVNPNGGSWNNSAASQNFSILYGGTKTIANPLRTGYRFLRWDLLGSGSKLNGTTFTMGNQNSSVTAQWQLITHSIQGNVTWEDESNKYSSRPSDVTATLNRTPTTGGVTKVPDPVKVQGESSYTFKDVQTYDTSTGNAYNYSVSQNQVAGYETLVNGYKITNKLVLPTYTSNIEYTPVGTYQDKFLKNGKIKINANVKANTDNREKVRIKSRKSNLSYR